MTDGGELHIEDGLPAAVLEEHDVSPDGRWLVFDSDRRGNMDLYRMPVGGGDADRQSLGIDAQVATHGQQHDV